MGDFVPEIVMIGLVPQKHDVRRLRGGKFIYLPAAGCIDKEHVTVDARRLFDCCPRGREAKPQWEILLWISARSIRP